MRSDEHLYYIFSVTIVALWMALDAVEPTLATCTRITFTLSYK